MARRIRPNEAMLAEEKVIAQNPGATIPIITGGTTVGHNPALGPDVLVEVTDTANAKQEGSHYFGASSRSGGWSWEKMVPLGVPVFIPERIVQEIEGKVETNIRRITPESALFGNSREAMTYNTGMRYHEDESGAYLKRTTRRWVVRRCSPDEVAKAVKVLAAR